MRIRGKKPWALIEGKIVRFKSNEDFDRWEENHIRQRLEQTDKHRAEDFLTHDEVWEELERHSRQRQVYFLITRRTPKKKIRRRRLWPA